MRFEIDTGDENISGLGSGGKHIAVIDLGLYTQFFKNGFYGHLANQAAAAAIATHHQNTKHLWNHLLFVIFWNNLLGSGRVL